jgi:CheY-like chemotaxis protein
MTANDAIMEDRRGAALLHIDDDPAALALVAQLVACRSDVRLLRAANAKRGLKLARAARPQVILLNRDLAGTDALQFMKLVREDPATQSTPILALGADVAPGAVTKSLEAGFFQYLAKPIKAEPFLVALSHALEFAARELEESR